MGWAAKIGFDWQQILDHPNLAGWFTENRNVADPRIHPFSLGIPCPDVGSWIDCVDDESTWDAAMFEAARDWWRAPRGDSIFGCWHDRSGHVSGTSPVGADERSLCRAQLAPEPFFTWVEPGLSRQQFLAELRTHAFVSCPHRGGLGPSPRAWEGMHVGTIPIVKRSTTPAAFTGLPVVVVDEWSDITAAALSDWSEEHRSAIEPPDLEHLLSNQALLDRVRATL